MRTDDFDYSLDPKLIAQQPLPRRDRSRLMVLDRAGGTIEHHVFAELPGLLHRGDVLVINDTRVIPAKFVCRRATGGRLDGLFLRQPAPGLWEVMLRGAGRCGVGEELALAGSDGVRLKLAEDLGAGLWQVGVAPPAAALEVLERAGRPPLPPYIRRFGRSFDDLDRRRYQTVYADKPGAVAAPTAGLHLTDDLLGRLARAGIETARVTLHVGLGTFAPVKVDEPARHRMHAEWYEVTPAAARLLSEARRGRRRIVAVGTTSVRVLETAAAGGRGIRAAEGWTDLFIHPPAAFRAADALITNFHLPRSTLLMLAAAFCSPGETRGVKLLLDAYAEAVRLRYRFYSYGDAMLIL